MTKLHPCATCRQSRWQHSAIGRPYFSHCLFEHKPGICGPGEPSFVPVPSSIIRILRKMWDKLN